MADTTTTQGLFGKVDKTIDAARPELGALNKLIHSNPELNFQEDTAHDAYVKLLQEKGFNVTPHAYGIPTAFEAEYGSGGRLVVFNAEYDALPGIGHACGHNILGMTSLAGFLAAVERLKQANIPGRVRVLGTPAEEGGGGKAALVKMGAYDGVDACVMAHPAPLHQGYSTSLNGSCYIRHTSIQIFNVVFKGKNAHAAANPWDGINALDATVMAYNGISMVRQQILRTESIHGKIIEGGLAHNIIPDRTSMEYCIRSPNLNSLQVLKQKLLKCFRGAAMSTSCDIEITEGNIYADLRPNKTICHIFGDEMAELGLPFLCDTNDESVWPASTDQGNVSYVVPAFQACYGIPAGEGCFNHTIGFTEAAISDEAFERSLVVATGLGNAAWKILTDDALATKMRQEFEDDRTARGGSPEADKALVSQWDGNMNRDRSVNCTCGRKN